MNAKQVSELLGSKYVSKYKGQFRYWKSYFYRHGMTTDKMIEHVKAKIPAAVITGDGDHFHSFVGGAKSGTAQDSYLWVTFTVEDKPIEHPGWVGQRGGMIVAGQCPP